MFVFLKCHGLSRLQAFALPWLTSTRLWWASHLDRRGFRLCQSFFFGCHCLINLWQIRISVYMFTIVYIIVYIHYSPNSVSTLRGCYGRSKGRCLIRVLQLGRGIFPVNFRTKWLLWNDLTCILTAQARTKSVSAFWAQSGARHFSCKFRSKVALLNFWLSFRLRRLAQSLCVCLRSGLNSGRGIFPEQSV